MNMNSSEYRYWAFISYSSKDKKWGRWIHRAIERYGIPAKLVGHSTTLGHPVPKRLKPVFRDRDELSASFDLGASIEEALRQSRYLIVVCSPHAAQSRWVNKEIETFRKFGRSQNILPLIVGGKPNSGDDRECFPTSLGPTEPLAADVRREEDGKTNAKLKMIAGMLGLGFDTLKDRDRHRRMSRMRLLTVLFFVVAVSFGLLANYSNVQRIKAVKARNQSEKILEFLLFDLRDKLAPLGRLDIVQEVQEKVDVYYRELGERRDDSEALRIQGVAYDNEGNLLAKKGDFSGALKAYQEALAIASRLASNDPDNAIWQSDLSNSQLKIGDMLAIAGDSGGALKLYRESLAVQRKLPAGLADVLGLSDCNDRIGSLLLIRGDAQGAADALRASLEMRVGVSKSLPKDDLWKFKVSTSHFKLGEVWKYRGDYEKADSEFRVALDILNNIMGKDSADPDWEKSRAECLLSLGDVSRAQGRTEEALEEYAEALAVAESLNSRDASNGNWKTLLITSEQKMGDFYLERKAYAEAFGYYRKSVADGKKLYLSTENNPVYVQAYIESIDKLADVLLAMNNYPEALKAYEDTIATQAMFATAYPDIPFWRRSLAASCLKAADTASMTDAATAKKWRMKAYDLLVGMKEKGWLIAAEEDSLKKIRLQLGK